MTSIWKVCVKIGLVLTFCCTNSTEILDSKSAALPTCDSLVETCIKNGSIMNARNGFTERFKPCFVTCSGTDNCCLEDENIANSFNLSCHSAYYDFAHVKNTSKTSRPTMDYEMVTTCPDGRSCDVYNDNESTLVTFNDIVAVYNEEYRVIFMNRACALCNGVASYHSWKFMAADCIGFDYTQTRYTDRELLSYIVDNCMLFSLPPNHTIEEYQRHRCDMSDVKQVAQSCVNVGQNVTMENIEFTTRSEFLTLGESQMYQNTSCVFCKNGSAVTVTQRCPPRENQNPLDNFNMTFDMDLHYDWKRQHTIDQQERCKENEIYDDHYNICRPYTCSGFERLMSRVCLKKFPFTVSPIVYSVNLIFVPSKQQTVDGNIKSLNKTESLKFLQKVSNEPALRLNKCTISSALMKLYFKTKTRVIHSMLLEMQIKDSHFCSYEHLSAKFTALYRYRTPIVITFNLDSVNTIEFIIRQAFRIPAFLYSLGRQSLINVNGTYQSRTLIRISDNSTYCPPSFEIDGKPGCARIEFNVSDYCQLTYILRSKIAFPKNKTCFQFFDNALDYNVLQSLWLADYTTPRDFSMCLRYLEPIMKNKESVVITTSNSNKKETKPPENSSKYEPNFLVYFNIWYHVFRVFLTILRNDN